MTGGELRRRETGQIQTRSSSDATEQWIDTVFDGEPANCPDGRTDFGAVRPRAQLAAAACPASTAPRPPEQRSTAWGLADRDSARAPAPNTARDLRGSRMPVSEDPWGAHFTMTLSPDEVDGPVVVLP